MLDGACAQTKPNKMPLKKSISANVNINNFQPKFPKFKECAHFHYEYVNISSIELQLLKSNFENEPLQTAAAPPPPPPTTTTTTTTSSNNGTTTTNTTTTAATQPDTTTTATQPNAATTTAAAAASHAASRQPHTTYYFYLFVLSGEHGWTVKRSFGSFCEIDRLLHKCVYNREVSTLPEMTSNLIDEMGLDNCFNALRSYIEELSARLKDTANLINCGPILAWLEMDNKGKHLLVLESEPSVNIPAIGAGQVIEAYIAQASDELSFEVGDIVSIIDKPTPQESLWWLGKKNFKAGYFPSKCVELITGSTKFTGSASSLSNINVTKPVLSKRGKFAAFLHSFFSTRPNRNNLKSSGIVKERLFGCDLGEHLLDSGLDVPTIVTICIDFIEKHGLVDGIYRLSGITSNVQKLRNDFDSCMTADLNTAFVLQDLHCVSSLLKMYFRELPNPLFTYQLYQKIIETEVMPNNASMLNSLAHVIHLLPPPHYRTAKALFLHLNFMSSKASLTCMDSRNLSIVWAPNILNSNFEVMKCENMLVISNQQAAIVECIINNAQFIFKEFSSSDLSDVSQSPTLQPKHQRQQQQKQRQQQQQQQKHLHPPNSPAKLISLEEAQKLFGGCVVDEANPRRCGPMANFGHRASVDGVEGDAVFTDLGVTGNIHAVIDPPKRISKMKGFKSFQDLSSKIVPVEDKCGLYSSIDEVTKHPVYHSFEENLNYADAGNENDDDNEDGDGKSDFVPLESNKKASKSRNSDSKMTMTPKKFSESDSYLVEDFHANACEKAPQATTTVVTTAKTNARSSSIRTALKPAILAATTTTPATTATAATTSKFGRLNSVKNLFSKSSHTADSTSKQPQKLQQQPQRQQQQQLVENIKVPEKTGKDLVKNPKFAVEDIRTRRMNLVSRPNTQMFFNEPSSQAGESFAAASPATKQQRSSLEQLDPPQVDDQQQPQSQQQQFSQQIPLQQQKLQQHYQNIVRLQQQQQQPNQPPPPPQQQEQQLPQTSQQTTPPATIMTTFKPDATTSNDKSQVKVSTASQQPTATLSKLSTTTAKETSDDANLTTKPKFQPPRKLTDESLTDKKCLNGNTTQQLQQQSKLSRQLPTERNKTFIPSSAMKPTVSSSLKQKPLINPCSSSSSSSSTTQDPSKKRFPHCSSPTTTNPSPTGLSTAFFPATFETTSSSTVLATKLQLPCDVIESSLKKMEMFLSGGEEEEEEEEERRNNQLASSLTASSFRGSVDGDGVGEATSKTAAQQTGDSTVVRDVFKVIPANSLRCKSPQKLAQTTRTSKMRTSAPWRVDVSHQNEGADAAVVTLVAINKPSTPSFLSKNQPADVQSKQTIMEELIKWKENKMNSNQADDNSSKNFATHNASSVSSKDDISSKVGPYKPSAVEGIYGSSLFQSGAYNISTGSSAGDVSDVGSPIKNRNTSRVYAVAVDNSGSNLQVNPFKNSGIVGLSGREECGNDLVKQLRTDRGRVNPIQQSNSRSAHYEFVRPKTIMYNQNNCELEELLYSPSYNVSGHSNEMSASAEDFEKVHFVENINNNFNPEFDQLNRNNNNNNNSKGNIAYQSNSQHDYDNVFLGCNNNFDDSNDIIRSINNCKYNRRARDDTSVQFTNLHKNSYKNILNESSKNPVRNKANNAITFTSSNNSLFDATNHAKHFAHQQNACNRNNNNSNNAYHHINTNQSSYNQTESRMVSKEGSLTSKSFSNDDILALKYDVQLVLPYNNYHQQQQFNQLSRHQQQQQQQQHSRSVGMQPKPVHRNHGSDPIGRGTSSVVPYSFLGSNPDKRQNRISSVFVQPINPPIKSYNQNNNNFVNSNVNINNSSYGIDNNFNRFAVQNSGKFLSQSHNGGQASFYDKNDVGGQIYFTDDDRYNNNYYYNNNSYNNINNNINNSNVNYINTNNNRYNHNIINYNISDDNNNNLNNNNYDGKVSKYVTIVNVESDSSVHGGDCDYVRITNPSLI